MKKLRVLIVDDVAADVEATAAILRREGHEVLSTNDGGKSQKIADIEQPDVILMDLVMPGVNGFQATRELGRSASTMHIPVIVVSRKDEEIDRGWARKQGAKAYLTKGFSEAELFVALASVTQDAQAQSETGEHQG